MSKSLILVSGRKDDAEFAAEVAATAGLSLKVIPDAPNAAQVINQEEQAVVLVDITTQQLYQAFETAIQEVIGLFSDRANPNFIHFISNEGFEAVPYLVQSPLLGNFIVRTYMDPKEAGQHYGRIIKASLNERAFGAQQLLKEGTKVQVIKLKESTQKQEAVEAVRNYLVNAKFQTRMAAVIANAVDELLMNAIFDAPVDDMGRQTLASTSRKTLVKLEGKHAIEMYIGFDGNYVAISTVDFFGSLDKARLLTHISKKYSNEEYKVRTAVAGAGLGLATVFHSGGSFFFCSENGVKTEVTVFFKRADSFRAFKDQFRFVATQFYF